MKKILVFLAFVIAVGFTACDDKDDKQKPDPNPAEYTITFDANEGTGGPTTAKAIFGEPMPAITAQAPTRTGHDFNGYFDAGIGGVKYYDANLASVKNWDKKEAATLFAQWTQIPPPAGSFTITFNASGGTGGPTTVVAEYGKAMPALTAQIPIKAGLYFSSTNNGMTVDSNVGAEDEGGWYFKGYFDGQDSAAATSVGKQYYDADLRPIGNWDKQADTTLYALFIGKYDQLIPFVETAPVIDGNGNDAVWAKAEWIPLNQVWLGNGNAGAGTAANKFVPTGPTADDFTGRFKIVWTADKLYYLAEITDDVLRQVNTWQSGNMYQDDILELFIDEDASGGAYGGASSLGGKTRYNAFAHHMAITGNNGMYVTGSQDGGYVLLNHMTDYIIGNKDNANGSNLYTWEVGLLIVKDDYVHNRTTPASPTTMNVVSLTEGKKMGFAVAYCDSDNKTNSGNREHFMGSVFSPRQDKNQAYQSANGFAKMYLVK